MNWTKDDFIVSDDTALINIDVVSQLLSKTYWAQTELKKRLHKALTIQLPLVHITKENKSRSLELLLINLFFLGF
ncbi:hypothetical protein ACFFJQ_17210 [Bacillus capparidis]|uniref:hypothetical protein n=1 Tax=Bacillus capparidis TaxID=1840411 RepID=UPI0026790A64